jgi:membrane-bound metal-dependent hydrolase YbcI (DUF457 family)
MSLREAWRVEVAVATSRRAQPVWFRVVKWIVIIAALWYFRRSRYLWPGLGAAFALSIGLHLLWRVKTRRWTRPWRGWSDVETAERARTR